MTTIDKDQCPCGKEPNKTHYDVLISKPFLFDYRADVTGGGRYTEIRARRWNTLIEKINQYTGWPERAAIHSEVLDNEI